MNIYCALARISVFYSQLHILINNMQKERIEILAFSQINYERCGDIYKKRVNDVLFKGML